MSACIVCQSLPHMDETALHVLVRHQQAQIERLVNRRVREDIALDPALPASLPACHARIVELEGIVTKLNKRIRGANYGTR